MKHKKIMVYVSGTSGVIGLINLQKISLKEDKKQCLK